MYAPKWLTLICLTMSVSIILILIQQSSLTTKPFISDGYMNDVRQGVYEDVLSRWYNFTGDKRWYNDKEISPSNLNEWEKYLKEIRENWIVWKHNPNMSYVLDKPEVKDPSMGQAKAIREIFKDKKYGFFVECGAYDGETRSNTLVLERSLNWTGLLIEADTINFSKMLEKNRKAYLSPTCLSIWTKPTVASFLMAKNIGRLHDPKDVDAAAANSADVAHSGVHIQVQCFPFAHYIAALGIKTVDYFSLDIEGNEMEVLETIPFDQIDIKALSVEHVHGSKGRKYLIDFMEARGYYAYKFVERSDNLANDVIFAKRES